MGGNMLADLISKSGKALKGLATRSVYMQCDRIPYEFHNVPLKKIANWILVEASMYVKPGRPWGWPTHLQVEPDAHCNLSCVVCPVTTGMGRAIGRMDLDLFKKMIDEVGDYVFLILLWDWGEPFLNPAVYDMIAYAKQKEIQIVSSTNGHCFTQERHVDAVIRSGLDTLIVALDGITQESYERYRQGGSLESVLSAVRSLVRRKHELGSETPLLNLRFVVMKQNEHEIPGVIELAQSLGVDALTLKTFNPYGDDPDFIPEDPRYRRFDTRPGSLSRIRRGRNPCKHFWNMPSIHWSGRVSGCTFDAKEAFVLGDLHTANFREIWRGAAARRLRKQFRFNWEQLGLCRECTYAYEGGSCIDEIIADAFFFEPGSGA
jgi:radical SAM protein with 4Fe4S-binding SPASM domain